MDHPVEADHKCLLLNDVASHPLKYILLKMEIKFRNLEKEREREREGGGERKKGGRERGSEREGMEKEIEGKIREREK